LGIAKELEQARIGILCLTPENLNSNWILFEAGALSRSVENSFVCPLLLGIEPSEVEGPLAQFQATRLNADDMLLLMKNINGYMGETDLSEMQLIAVFEQFWPQLAARLSQMSPGITQSTNGREHHSNITRETQKLEKLIAGLEAISIRLYRTPSSGGNVPFTIEGVKKFVDAKQAESVSSKGQDPATERLLELVDELLINYNLEPELAWQLAKAVAIMKDEREDIRTRIARIVADAEGAS
jgi:hypothetical protein